MENVDVFSSRKVLPLVVLRKFMENVDVFSSRKVSP